MVSKLTKKTAKELAGAFFENEDTFADGRAIRSDRFRATEKSQEAFVARYWPDFVPLARKFLTHMLTEPGRNQAEKNQIHDALLQDRGFLTDEQLAAPSVILLN